MAEDRRTKDELIVQARKLGLTVTSAMKKEQLSALVREAEDKLVQEDTLMEAAPVPFGESVAGVSTEDDPSDDTDRSTDADTRTPREQAAALGLLIPEDWDDAKVAETVAAFSAPSEPPSSPQEPATPSDEAEPPPTPPRPRTGRWKGHSPRG